MRILFLESSSIWPYTLPQGLRDLGHEIMISGPLTQTNIPEMIVSFNPDFVVSIGWGNENTRKKQEWIGRYVHEAGVPLIYWAIEDPAFTKVFSLPLINKMQPDFVFTLCPEMVKYYRNKGIKAAHLEFAFNPGIHRPVAAQPEFSSSIAVVANAYPDILAIFPRHYRHTAIRTLIAPLLNNNIRIDFWGQDWERMLPSGLNIPKDWLHGPIPYVNANQVYSSTDIVLGLQNYQHIVTQRTFEILASGGFLLTIATPAVLKLTPDIIVSSSPEETLSLIDYYLQYPEKRRQIQEKTRNVISGHTYQQRAEYMLRVLHEQGIVPLNN